MAIDPLIARGYQGGIVNAFQEGETHRARMDDRTEMHARRNALVDIERQDSQQRQITAQQQQALLQKFGDIQALKKLPPEAASRWLEQQRAEPGFANTPWANAPAEQAIPAIEAQIASILGLQPEQPKQAPSQAAEIQRYEYGLRVPGFREYEDRNRPQPGAGAAAPKPGYGSSQDGINPQTGKPDKFIVDDFGNMKWLGVEPVVDGPKPRDVTARRKEFRGLQTVKDYETALPLLVSARNAPDTGYGDLQLIYTAGKILDPGSVVREGELQLTIAAGSPMQRLIGATQFNAEQGGRLPTKARKQLLAMLNERTLAYRQAYDRDYRQYADYAADEGMSPRDVVGRHAANAYPQQKKEAPAAAIEKLRQDPSLKPAFKAKYGYLPDGL